MTGVTAIMAGMSGGGSASYTLVGASYTDFSVDPVDAQVSIDVNSDGSLVVNTFNSGVLDNYNWITPTTGAATHYVRLTPTSGSFSGASTGVWLAVNTGWFVAQSVFGTNTATGTLAIATDSGGTNIVATASITLTAQVDI